MSKETRDANAEGRPSYKDTLNLLQTSFGMRANAVKREPELQGRVQSQARLSPRCRPILNRPFRRDVGLGSEVALQMPGLSAGEYAICHGV